MKPTVTIGNKKIGQNHPVFIVAEISGNHAQNFDRAIALIEEAKNCGVDAVKFQIFTPDSMTLNCDNKYFRVKHPKWGGQTLYQLYRKVCTPLKWFERLKKKTEDLGLIFLCSSFDKKGIDILESIDIVAHKIASFELADLPLIAHAGRTKKPLILSTGMSTVAEIAQAVDTATEAGTTEILLLKCVSNYPANPREMNLRTIPHMKDLFGCPIGLSES